MATKRKFELGIQYHLYGRGVDKRDTFLSEHDYIRFMALIHVCNDAKNVSLKKVTKTDPIVQIDQYCLMPNHFHILCTEISEKGISKFMQKILSGYTIFFNKKYNREGSLFSSTFKVKEINTDLYATYIKTYILYNPLKLILPGYVSKKYILNGEKLTLDELEFLNEYPYKKV